MMRTLSNRFYRASLAPLTGNLSHLTPAGDGLPVVRKLFVQHQTDDGQRYSESGEIRYERAVHHDA